MDLFTPVHILVLLVVALLIFGPKRLPEIGSGLGKTFRNFKAAMNEDAPAGVGGHGEIVGGDPKPREDPIRRPED